MSNAEEEPRSIADPSQANAGRIYDFLLGGNHNFEIDRVAARELLEIAPLMPGSFKLIRWFLGEAVRRLAAEGFDHFLDFASGLPTIDHVHEVTPKGTKVIYSDIDAVTVRYSEEIIRDFPQVRCLQSDAAQPEVVLQSDALRDLFGTARRVAIGYNGIMWFLRDEQITHAMRVLYDWANPGSKLFLTTDETTMLFEEGDPKMAAFAERYRKIGQSIYPRNRARLTELMAPWRLIEPGYRLVEDWLEVEVSVNRELARDWKGLSLYGAIFVK